MLPTVYFLAIQVGLRWLVKGEINFEMGVLWFPWILFLAEIVLYMICLHIHSTVAMFIILTGSFAIALLFDLFAIVLPLYLNVLPSALFIIGLASLLKDRIKGFLSMMTNHKFGLLLAALLLISPLYTIILEHRMEMAGNTFGIDDYGIAFITTIGVLLICSIIGTSRLLEYLGRNTFLILALHKTLIDFSVFYIQPQIQSHLVFKMIQFGFIWAVCLLLIPFVNKYIPQLVGKH